MYKVFICLRQVIAPGLRTEYTHRVAQRSMDRAFFLLFYSPHNCRRAGSLTNRWENVGKNVASLTADVNIRIGQNIEERP